MGSDPESVDPRDFVYMQNPWFSHGPSLSASIEFNNVYLNINRHQYSDVLDLLEYVDYLNMKTKFIKYYQYIDDNEDIKPSRKR
ncbi:hypothetical protein I4U23_016560 [Adineta vaga]|nr:hypothetical protein I4U23_016560 [Adineta vaga]